jgi:hypothetical protein
MKCLETETTSNNRNAKSVVDGCRVLVVVVVLGPVVRVVAVVGWKLKAKKYPLNTSSSNTRGQL